MTNLAWVVFGGIVLTCALVPLTYIVGDLATKRIRRHVDLALSDETRDAEIEQAIALSQTPLHDRIAYEYAHDFDPDLCDWTEAAGR